LGQIKKFEDMDIWQDARMLAKDCYDLSLIAKKEMDYDLMNALPKTSASIMDNISEGFGRGGNREFIQFLSISFASCLELKSQLYRISDRPYFKEPIEPMLDRLDSLKNRINGFIVYLRQSETKGYKFKEDSDTYQIKKEVND